MKVIPSILLALRFILNCLSKTAREPHSSPLLFAVNEDSQALLEKTESHPWANRSWNRVLEEINLIQMKL